MTSKQLQTGIIRQEGSVESGLNLGGIGTGGVELWADGRFHFWNMLNTRPWANLNKYAHWDADTHHTIDPIEPGPGHADFFVRVQEKGKRPVYRWLFSGYGNTLAAGHFWRHHKFFFIKSVKAIEYRAEYPFIYLDYKDDEFPVEVRLCAWTSMIPRDVKNSSLPGFYLDFSIRNRTRAQLEVSLVWQQQNLSGFASDKVTQRHSKLRKSACHMVRMEGSLDAPNHDTSGCMTLWAKPSKGQRVTSVASNPHMPNLIWPIHLTGGLDGPLYPEHIEHEEVKNPAYEPRDSNDPQNKGWLCVQQKVAAGKTADVNLGMAWYYPNHRSINGTRLGHVYENWFDDSTEVAAYLARNHDKFFKAARLMPELLINSDMPKKFQLSLLDQINTLTKSTQFIGNGRFGLQEGHGCCAFNTMDVDHYSSYTLSLLWPELRAKVMDQQTEIAHPETGKIHHGLPKSVEAIEAGGEKGYNRWDNCCQYILQLYRDAKWGGDMALIERSWETAKRAIEVIINIDFYDVGLPYIEGGITYDHWRMKGIVGYMAGLYLAALLAMEDLARRMDEAETAERMRQLFERGRDSFEELLWNGEQYLLYYGRRPKGAKIDEKSEKVGEEGHLHAQKPSSCCTRPGAYVELKDTGVMTDLINGNGTAAVMGLGAFLDPKRVKQYLKLILDRNHQPENQCVINGSYPDGHFLDGWPFMQWQTPWTGTEYFLAAQLYAAGMVKEGDQVIDDVYDRHVREGMRFDQSECSNHYARPLSIWAAYTARLGMDLDLIKRAIVFKPVKQDAYQGLLMTGTATCMARYKNQKTVTTFDLDVRDGKLELKELTLKCSGKASGLSVAINDKEADASLEAKRGEARIELSRIARLKPEDRIRISLEK